MSVVRLREIKREIRVLGLASYCNPDTGTHEIVCVIFRGKHWLDEVLKTSSDDPSITREVAETIRRSNHHPQIRSSSSTEPSSTTMQRSTPTDYPERPRSQG